MAVVKNKNGFDNQMIMSYNEKPSKGDAVEGRKGKDWEAILS